MNLIQKLRVKVDAELNDSIVTITREEAKRLLELFPEYRPIDKEMVQKYTNEMERGNWYLSKESALIGNCETGMMEDGKRRLTAFLKTGLKEFKTWFKFV